MTAGKSHETGWREMHPVCFLPAPPGNAIPHVLAPPPLVTTQSLQEPLTSTWVRLTTAGCWSPSERGEAPACLGLPPVVAGARAALPRSLVKLGVSAWPLSTCSPYTCPHLHLWDTGKGVPAVLSLTPFIQRRT